jgi:very-short-patch-repair endonuclease
MPPPTTHPSLLRDTCGYAGAKVRVAQLAKRQWGVVSQGQLMENGLSRTAIRRWIREQRLFRLHPCVYAVGHPAIGLEGRLAAALFYAGPGAALSHTTAASWWNIVQAEPRRIHVCVPGRRKSLRDVCVHEQKSHGRTWQKRLPVTPPARTLLDIAGQVRFMELRRALAEAEFLKLVTLKEVERVLGRGKPGSAALRAALDCHRPQLAASKSALEDRLILLCERYSITQPHLNVWIAGWLVDAVWFDQKVVVELDSQLAHGTPAALERDHRRDLELRAAGYTVLRYTWQQLTETPEPAATDLRRHLGPDLHPGA